MPPLPRNNPLAVDALDSRLAGLIAESAALRTDLKSSEAQRRKENLISMAVGVLIIIFIALVLGVAIQNRSISNDAATSAREAKRSADVVADCTTPQGKCYQDGTKRTGGAVGNLVRAQIIVAECDRANRASDSAFKACLATRLKAFTTPAPPG